MILVVNAGSSNTKFAIYQVKTLHQIYRGQVNSIQDVFAWLKEHSDYKITSVGHRIVHGGSKFFAPVVLTAEIMSELQQLIPLAPLHQPHNLAAIEYLQTEYPELPQIGCFDTAFHRTQNKLAKQFAIPAELTADGVIRYGFHGLSYEYIASILETKIGPQAKGKVIVAHLGNGASLCAMNNLQSKATTMGFSALDGLVMGSRCGNIDPGVLLYLLQAKNFSSDRLTKFLYNECGLLGVSGISNDMRELINNHAPSAQNAIELFCYRAASDIGKLLMDLQGCEAIIFTAGIGEKSAIVRKKICDWLAWLGVELDLKANEENALLINAKQSKLKIAVIPTDEEYIIAKHVQNLT